jgi:hypothetical protein
MREAASSSREKINMRLILPPLVTNYLLYNENDIHVVIYFALITTVILKVVGNEN